MKNMIQFSDTNIRIIDSDRGVNYPKQHEFNKDGFCLFLSAKNITKYGFDLSDNSFITEDKDNILRSGKLERDDIIITTRGTVGNIGYYNEKIKIENIRINSGMVIIRADKISWDPYFLYIYLKSEFFNQQIKNIISGSAVPQLPIKDIKRLFLPKLSFNDQIDITNVIKPIDDKIHLNNQINQTLEAIAQAIFKSWFIDFDPVKAKAEVLAQGGSQEDAVLAAMCTISGKNAEALQHMQTTHPEQYQKLQKTAAAFPSAFVDSELGEIPEGWMPKNLGAITKSKRERVKNGDAIVLSAVSSGELIKSEEYFTKKVYSNSIEKYLKVEQWDFAYNPSRINIGSIGMKEESFSGAVSPVYEVFSVTKDFQWFIYWFLKLDSTKSYINILCSGSVRQTLKLTDLQTIPCVIPEHKIVLLFNILWDNIYTTTNKYEAQDKTLSEVINLILPELLSGNINIEEK